MSTAAAGRRLVVKVAAAAAGPSSLTMMARSRAPVGLMPALVPDGPEAARQPRRRLRRRQAGRGEVRAASRDERELFEASLLGQAEDEVEGLHRLAGGALDEIVRRPRRW